MLVTSATSAIDYKTDTIIQASLRTELKPDVTVITVAHRLQTILDSDKIVSLLAALSPNLTAFPLVHRWCWMRVASSVLCYFAPVVLTFPKQVEFDTPKALLKNPNGMLRALVDESGDKEKLYSMAEGKGK
jgi:ABC-type multidrug transport system fused ATPase/permease subunit